MCELFNGSIPTTTIWRVLYFNGSGELQTITNILTPNQLLQAKKDSAYQTELTLLNVSSNLDRVTVFCGINSEPMVGMFPLRVYGRSSCALSLDLSIDLLFSYPKDLPFLQDNITVKIRVGTENATIDLSSPTHATLSPRHRSTWWKDSQQLTGQEHSIALNNSSVFFSQITVNHSGIYSLSSTFYVDNDVSYIANGSFSLNVLCKFPTCVDELE